MNQSPIYETKSDDIIDSNQFYDIILEYCDTIQLFKKNWDPIHFDWENHSLTLCQKCSKFMEIWWDPNRFNWDYIAYLTEECNGNFDIWWSDDFWTKVTDQDLRCKVARTLSFHNLDKFDIWWDIRLSQEWLVCLNLTINIPSRFYDWWSEEYFPHHIPQLVESLCHNCPDNFEDWYQPKFYGEMQLEYIKTMLPQYKDIWATDYVEKMITK